MSNGIFGLEKTGTKPGLGALAATNGPWINLVFWSFPKEDGSGDTRGTVDFSPVPKGQVRLVRLNATAPVNNLEQISNEPLDPKTSRLLAVNLHPYHSYWVEVGVEKQVVRKRAAEPKLTVKIGRSHVEDANE